MILLAPGYYYPYYYGWPATYGAAAWYNPYTGTYGRGAVYYGPYGGQDMLHVTILRQEFTHAVDMHMVLTAQHLLEKRTIPERIRTQGRVRERTIMQTGDHRMFAEGRIARTAHVQGQEAGAWGYKTSNGNKGFVGYRGDDLYAGKNGDIYRKTDDGWQQWEGGDWNSAEPPSRPDNLPASADQGKSQASSKYQGQPRTLDSLTYDGLNRDAFSRSRGSRNVENYGSWRSSGGQTRTGTPSRRR